MSTAKKKATKRTPKPLTLYVWEDVLIDYTSGIAFALASSVAAARELISPGYESRLGNVSRILLDTDLDAKPKAYRKPIGFSVSGGG